MDFFVSSASSLEFECAAPPLCAWLCSIPFSSLVFKKCVLMGVFFFLSCVVVCAVPSTEKYAQA